MTSLPVILMLLKEAMVQAAHSRWPDPGEAHDDMHVLCCATWMGVKNNSLCTAAVIQPRRMMEKAQDL
jgi:hypothetical protein